MRINQAMVLIHHHQEMGILGATSQLNPITKLPTPYEFIDKGNLKLMKNQNIVDCLEIKSCIFCNRCNVELNHLMAMHDQILHLQNQLQELHGEKNELQPTHCNHKNCNKFQVN